VPAPSSPAGKSASRPSGKRRGCGLRVALFLLVLLLAAGVLVYVATSHRGPAAAGCTVKTDGGDLDLDQDQAANAATIAAVAASRGLPARALTIALATSMQESQLHNLDHGDRDSLGLFQQRPSQGWGTAQQILDPVFASDSFFDSLVKIHDYQSLPLTVAAQEVQRSGYPEAYAQHETDATQLSLALTGQDPAALSCTTGADTPYSAGGRLGRADQVTARLTREFGKRVEPKQESDPRTVSVPVPTGGSTAADEQRGWAVAQWAVAHAHDLKVEQVSFGGRQWQAAHSERGWQQEPAPGKSKGKGSEQVGAKGESAAAAGDPVRITVAR
jgi:hypothetical protein